MKILGEKFINYPIKHFPDSTVQKNGCKNTGAITNTFMSISIPLSGFPGLYVFCKGSNRSLNCFSGPLLCRKGIL